MKRILETSSQVDDGRVKGKSCSGKERVNIDSSQTTLKVMQSQRLLSELCTWREAFFFLLSARFLSLHERRALMLGMLHRIFTWFSYSFSIRGAFSISLNAVDAIKQEVDVSRIECVVLVDDIVAIKCYRKSYLYAGHFCCRRWIIQCGISYKSKVGSIHKVMTLIKSSHEVPNCERTSKPHIQISFLLYSHLRR